LAELWDWRGYKHGAPNGAWLRSTSSVLAAVWLAAAFTAPAATIAESFTTNPLTRGWRVFGSTNLFAWDSTNQNLRVTWDSSQTNSYFYVPLGTILDRYDDFSLALDLELLDIAAGIYTNKTFTFEMTFGFLNLVDATKTNFFRGNGGDSPNLVEFDFFPQAGTVAPTVWPAFWSTNSVLNYNGPNDYTLIDLPVGVVMRITMNYTGSNQTLVTSITTNGVSIGPIYSVKLSPTFTDFRAGAFAIESYSDAGQNPRYDGSLLAHGIVDNVLLTVPPPPVQDLLGYFAASHWQVQFTSRTNWSYALEASADLKSWTPVSQDAAGNGVSLILADTNTVFSRWQFYRVRAERP